jgi:hypothetical protein
MRQVLKKITHCEITQKTDPLANRLIIFSAIKFFFVQKQKYEQLMMISH